MRIVEQQNRNNLEAMLTSEEALALAIEHHRNTGRWPGRRFRVVGRFGNSHLLTRHYAERAQERYGGEVVELVPTRQAYLADLRAQEMRR